MPPARTLPPVDIGGDGDDDSGPVTAKHVLAEAKKNGIKSKEAVVS